MAREDIGAEGFFRALYRGIGGGFIEIRPLGEGSTKPPQRRFFRINVEDEFKDCVRWCEELSGKFHVYFGVGLRKDGKLKKGAGGKENVGVVTAVFADVDWKDVPENEAREKLKAFPIRPSIVVRSGHGIHLYWMLSSPAMLEKDLERLQAVNLAILRHFKAQRGVQDYSRILRVPGTLNIKADYPDPKPVCSVTYFHPETTYTLEDFEGSSILKDILSQPAGAKAPADPAPAPQPTARPADLSATPPPAHSEKVYRPRPVPSYSLPEEDVKRLGALFAEIWMPGQRHAMALRVAGMLAFSKISRETALEIVRIASDIAGGETEKRLKDVHDTYERFVRGAEVAGGPDLERMISEEFPQMLKQRAQEVVKKIRRYLPVQDKEDGRRKKVTPPDFEVVGIEKFNSRPALYNVRIRRLDSDKIHTIERCEHKIFHYFNLFRLAFNEETDLFIAPIEQWQWEELREQALAAGTLESKAAPEEATVTGILRETLESFLLEKKESPADGELKVYAGYNTNDLYFALRTYKGRLKEAGVRITDQVITDFLRRDGWTDERRRVNGGPAHRLWYKHLNGHAKVDPSQKSHAPQDPLFPSNESNGEGS